MNPKKKKSAHEIRNEIGISFPKGMREAGYDYERYQSNIIHHQDKFIEFLVSKLNVSRETLEEEFETHMKG